MWTQEIKQLNDINWIEIGYKERRYVFPFMVVKSMPIDSSGHINVSVEDGDLSNGN